MQFTKWFNLKKTPQSAPIPGTSQVRNGNARLRRGRSTTGRASIAS